MKQRNPIDLIARELDVSDSDYETAEKRYSDLGAWLSDDSKAKSARFSPHVYPQGSFQLGTAIKPLHGGDYDVDIVCVLTEKLSKTDISQEQLKHLVGVDLQNYRHARNVQDEIIEKQRCWRLNYQDEVPFHLDILPALPQSQTKRQELLHRMNESGIPTQTAEDIADKAIAITDKKHRIYRAVTSDWPISNPEGYAIWFRTRMNQAQELLALKAMQENVAQIDDLPAYRWRTPLQRAIQLLKRHRDVMFERNPEGKPISIIITTLAAKAYNGEVMLEDALTTILTRMPALINQNAPLVPNPVNPHEDFADKWRTPAGQAAQLEANFYSWLTQARTDLNSLRESTSDRIVERAKSNFNVRLKPEEVHSEAIDSASNTRVTSISDVTKPWRR